MIPSFEEFQVSQKLKKYTFHPPTEHVQWGSHYLTQKVTGPRGGETFAVRGFYGEANRLRCMISLKKTLEEKILRRLQK